MPLSSSEEKILLTLEKDLSDRYPSFERKMKRFENRSGRGWLVSSWMLSVMAGAGLMILGLCIGSTLLGVLAFLLMSGGAYLASMTVGPGIMPRFARRSPPRSAV